MPGFLEKVLINKLMMRGYVMIIDFDYEVDKNGEFYGWGISRYSTPEQFYGPKYIENSYRITPEESYKRLFRHIKKLNTDADELQIKKFLG